MSRFDWSVGTEDVLRLKLLDADDTAIDLTGLSVYTEARLNRLAQMNWQLQPVLPQTGDDMGAATRRFLAGEISEQGTLLTTTWIVDGSGNRMSTPCRGVYSIGPSLALSI